MGINDERPVLAFVPLQFVCFFLVNPFIVCSPGDLAPGGKGHDKDKEEEKDYDSKDDYQGDDVGFCWGLFLASCEVVI
jgi:hypothetical protein